MKKLFFVFILTSIAESATTQKALDIDDQDLACQIYNGFDFTHFNLTSLDKKGNEKYSKDGIEWRFCEYLPGTETFAQVVDHKKALTSDSFEPD